MRFLSVALSLTLLAAGALAAPVFDLTEEQIGALPAPAQSGYQASIRAFQAGEHVQGFGHLLRASQAAPESAGLQLVLARLGLNMSAEYPDNAQRLLGVARVGAQRVMQIPGATPEQTAEARGILAQLGEEMEDAERAASAAASREALQAQIRDSQEASLVRQREEAARQRAAERPAQEAAQQPERNPDGTPRYTGSVRNYQAIQQARDLQQGSTN